MAIIAMDRSPGQENTVTLLTWRKLGRNLPAKSLVSSVTNSTVMKEQMQSSAKCMLVADALVIWLLKLTQSGKAVSVVAEKACKMNPN